MLFRSGPRSGVLPADRPVGRAPGAVRNVRRSQAVPGPGPSLPVRPGGRRPGLRTAVRPTFGVRNGRRIRRFRTAQRGLRVAAVSRVDGSQCLLKTIQCTSAVTRMCSNAPSRSLGLAVAASGRACVGSLSPEISDFRDDERRLAEPSFEPRFRVVAPSSLLPLTSSRGLPRPARSASLRERSAPFEVPPDIG